MDLGMTIEIYLTLGQVSMHAVVALVGVDAN